MHILVLCLAAFAVTDVFSTSPPRPEPEPCKGCPKNEQYLKQTLKCQITCKNMHLEPYMGPCYPSDGCFCIKDYVRDANGKCIPRKDCPTYCKDPLKEWTDCGSACPPSCANYNNTCLACTMQCVQGCFCKKDYVLNADGDCIKPEDCPRECGDYQKWDWCPPNCPHQNCSAIWSKFDCSKASKCCAPQCRCIDGYYRNNKGICVTIDECLAKCGDNSHYDDCSTACKSKNCVPGCVCDDGYVMKDGVCVKEGEENQCPVNEHWSECINPCPEGAQCFAPCIAGCLCDDGYKRNNEGICVQKIAKCGDNSHYDDCSTACKSKNCVPGCVCDDGYVMKDGVCVKEGEENQCPVNEHWSECINPCPEGAQCFAPCIAGCLCDDGYKRNNEGICVQKNPTCGDNEEFLKCGTACPLTCANPKPRPCTRQCVAGCFCVEGFVRDKNNNCIPVEDCPPRECDSETEEYKECGTACPDTCDNYDDTCGRLCTDNCVSGCFCKKGYVLNAAGKCIKTKHCPKRVCYKPHEHFENCPPNCPKGDGCNLLWSKFNCTGVPKCCTPSCRCDSGYFRNRYGLCVTSKQCIETGQCGDNAHHEESTGECVCDAGYYENSYKQCVKQQPTDPTDCGENAYYDDCLKQCPDGGICLANCKPGCKCNDGYVWNEYEGVCKRNIQCGNHAHYDECASRCPPGKICKAECVGGCVCDDGYEWQENENERICVRKQGPCGAHSHCVCDAGYHYNNKGVCVKDKKDCGPNSHYDECPPINCPPGKMCLQVCEPACVCDDGYKKNNNGDCVKIPKVCGPHSHYDECPPIICPPGMACAQVCRPACVCDDGYKKNKDGDCVKISKECGPHSHYDMCPPNNCPPGMMCPAVCKPACVCDKGYKYNKEGKCVKDTSKQCPVDEVYNECGTACPLTCKNPKPPKFCITLCVEGCFCKPGLVRNDKGKCVPPNQCPPQCKDTEEYKECGTACPPTCNKPNPTTCPKNCVSGCFCKPGLYRNNDGDCVPFSECPNDCGDNEIYSPCAFGCPTNWCPESNGPQPQCMPPYPCKPGCVCKAGYKRNNRDENICIKEKECPPPVVCGNNEHFEKCGTACPATCDNPDPKVCTKQCVRGCFCDGDLVRDQDGKCISREQCSKKCKPTEVFKECGSACPRTCEQPGPRACTKQCVSGCFCKDGLFRTKDGDCVEFPKCPNTCGRNETLAYCAASCPTDFCRESNAEPPQCDIPNPCNPGCICKKGYLRNNMNENICILKEDCPPAVICGKDEHYNTCGTSCPATCDEPGPRICDKKCNRGCFCNGDLVRNKEGKCVYKDKCPAKNKCTKPNEVWDECNAMCQNTCDDYDNPGKVCPAICSPGCICAKGYVRNKDGDCVEIGQCPKKDKCGVNEEYQKCGTACPKTCKNKDQPIKCTKQCVRGCFCKGDLVRNDKGICVPAGECEKPKECPVNEEYKTCGTACPKTCKNKDLKINCIQKCVEGCFCKGDLVRNDDGKCVSPKECKKRPIIIKPCPKPKPGKKPGKKPCSKPIVKPTPGKKPCGITKPVKKPCGTTKPVKKPIIKPAPGKKPCGITKPVKKPCGTVKPVKKPCGTIKPVKKPCGTVKPVKKPCGTVKPVKKPCGTVKPVKKPCGTVKPVKKPCGTVNPVKKPCGTSKPRGKKC